MDQQFDNFEHVEKIALSVPLAEWRIESPYEPEDDRKSTFFVVADFPDYAGYIHFEVDVDPFSGRLLQCTMGLCLERDVHHKNYTGEQIDVLFEAIRTRILEHESAQTFGDVRLPGTEGARGSDNN